VHSSGAAAVANTVSNAKQWHTAGGDASCDAHAQRRKN